MHVNNSWCALALGSNLGDRHALVESAIQALGNLEGLTNLESAPLYETEPVDVSPEYQDMLSLFATILSPFSAEIGMKCKEPSVY